MASELSDELPKTFGLWSGLSIGWNTINVFGGMSFILFVGLSAGGMPTVLYGLYINAIPGEVSKLTSSFV